MIVADYVRDRIDRWQSSGDISERTAGRCRDLCNFRIVPHLGAKLVQKLRTLDVEESYMTLRANGRTSDKGGLGSRTIGHAHGTGRKREPVWSRHSLDRAVNPSRPHHSDDPSEPDLKSLV